MASSSTYAFFHCHYAFQKFPFFCVQNATESHSAEHATHTARTGTFEMRSGSERMHTWRRTPSTGRNFQTLIIGLLSLKRQVVMVQFLSIHFFLGFLQFLLGFSKFPVFLCHPVYILLEKCNPCLSVFHWEVSCDENLDTVQSQTFS